MASAGQEGEVVAVRCEVCGRTRNRSAPRWHPKRGWRGTCDACGCRTRLLRHQDKAGCVWFCGLCEKQGVLFA